ncbi:hypothetical protein KRX56_08450 [Dermabacteraceae bacterium TAE3-ERU27]|nr:hypothetical protein [Dermabacteraceae bacterium TAE3-ERU27]
MPSYRMHIPIGQIRISPADVLAQAAECVPDRHTVEKKDIELVRGTPRLVIRFFVPPTSRQDEDLAARETLREAIMKISVFAEVTPLNEVLLTRREKGRFLPLSRPE